MIVRDEGDRLRLIRQADHAAQVASMAAHLSPVDERIIRAAKHHDDGWIERDARAHLDVATGLPHSYRNTPSDEYRTVWMRGIDRAVANDPYVGLLVSLHGTRFFANEQAAADQAFYAARRAEENELLTKLGLPGSWDALPQPLKDQHGWLRFLDVASLVAIDLTWPASYAADAPSGRIALERRGNTLKMDPLPLHEPVEFTLPSMILESTRYSSQQALDAAFASGRREPFSVRVTPA